jgi:hypothetical protein
MTLEVRTNVLGLTYRFIIVIICVNIWPPSVTLTLEVGVQVLYLTYCLMIVTICAKLFQNPLNYEEVLDRTQNIPYNRLC